MGPHSGEDPAEAKLEALVLDLRDNPGGLLDAAVSVSQQLVPSGTEIVSTAGRVYGEVLDQIPNQGGLPLNEPCPHRNP